MNCSVVWKTVRGPVMMDFEEYISALKWALNDFLKNPVIIKDEVVIWRRDDER